MESIPKTKSRKTKGTMELIIIEWNLLFLVAWYSIVRFLVSLNNFFQASFLPHHQQIVECNSILTICIPVRNEEERLPTFLKDLAQSKFSGSILFCDDQSDDHTYKILEDFAEGKGNIQIEKAPPIQANQLGKPSACAFLSARITTPYVLFVDVDVRLTKEGISDLIQTAVEQKSDLLSVFPFQRFRFLGEELVVPLMFQVLLSHLPLQWISNKKWWRLAAANGQILLFRTDFLQKHQLWEKVKASVVEDLLIAQWTKRMGGRLAVFFSDPRISAWMYSGSTEARSGFSKNITQLLGGRFSSLIHLFATVFFPVLLCFGPFWAWNILFFGLGWVSFCLNLHRKTALVPFQSWVYYPFYLIHFYRTLLLGLWKTLFKKTTWKNRVLPG